MTVRIKPKYNAEDAVALEHERSKRETAELLNRVGRVLNTELDPQKLTQTITDLATKLNWIAELATKPAARNPARNYRSIVAQADGTNSG